jgi:hypothetical protein
MPLTGIWRFATPLLDVADAGGAGAPAAVETPPVESDSLADHEATYSPDAQREPSADDDTRDDTGRFKPRHRAASQRADADDVPLISEHTRRIKDAESKLGADIARKDGESDRVFNLRRRAELLERLATPPAAPKAEPPPKAEPRTPPPAPRPAAAALPETFPTWEQWQEKNQEIVKAKGDAAWYDYQTDWGKWNYATLRQEERAQEAREADERAYTTAVASYQEKTKAFVATHPDFDTVVAGNSVSLAMVRATLDVGPESAYWLATHPEDRDALTEETLVDPKDPAFPSVVAGIRRYLRSVVASEQRSVSTSSSPSPSTRTAAAPTGSALALAPPPAPRPPNPVRTGSIAAPDTPPPDDDMSIASHEKHYSPRRR